MQDYKCKQNRITSREMLSNDRRAVGHLGLVGGGGRKQLGGVEGTVDRGDSGVAEGQQVVQGGQQRGLGQQRGAGATVGGGSSTSKNRPSYHKCNSPITV